MFAITRFRYSEAFSIYFTLPGRRILLVIPRISLHRSSLNRRSTKDRFHMTSRRPYLCKNKNNETAVMLVYHMGPVGIELFSHVKLSFATRNLQSCRPRE